MNTYKAVSLKTWLAAAFSLTLMACQTVTPDRPTGYQTGFLSPQVVLKPIPGHPETLRYIASDYRRERAKFTAIYIAPIEIWVAPDSPYQGLTADDAAALTTHFKQAFAKDIDNSIKIVDQPERQALTVRIALTNVELKHARFKLLQLTPVGAVVTGIKYVAGVSKVSVQHMVVQAEALEPENDKPLFAVVNYPLAQELSTQTTSVNHGENPAPDEPVRLDQLADLLATHAQRLQRTLLDLPADSP